MLNKKFKHKKIKPQAVKDADYLSWCHTQDLACFCCGERGSIELHHIKETSSDKRNDNEIIPLCGVKCHRLGITLSAHLTPKKFRRVFPMGMQLKYAKGLYNEYLKEVRNEVDENLN